MPTRYTSVVGNGTITTLREFTLMCARQFCSQLLKFEMTDPIPDKLEVDQYIFRAYKEAKEALDAFDNDPPDEKGWGELYKVEIEKLTSDHKKLMEERFRTKTLYLDMLDKVRNWCPPSINHVALKEFMVEQLDSSIKWDCEIYALKLPDLETFKNNYVKELNWNFEYYSKELAKEQERIKQANQWINSLKESLPNE